jgi:hypothetical protein
MILLQFVAGPPNSLMELDRSINTLLDVAPVLLQIAIPWGYLFAVLSILFFCWNGAMHALNHREEEILVEAVQLTLKILFVSFALRYYVTPIPRMGVSFPDFFTSMGRELAGVITLTDLDLLLGQINDCIEGMQHPPAWNFFGLIVYFFVLFAMSVLDTVLFVVVSFSFYAVAIGKAFGSILITMLLLPGWSQKFWNWVDFMFVYSMYRPVAAAAVLVLSNFLVNFFQNTMHGQYDLGHLSGLMAFLVLSIFGSVILAAKTPHLTVELFGGGLGHAGADFGSRFSSSVRSFVLLATRPV